ncbi:hypothetical protein [Roseovarius pacificus]|uniref:hypothetical protein n=1 Tax=Roseovarius pacificus TaxID=337701 RepID=UPI0011602596|nr:hypothetical protein [Roseovarius pacificus]GGO59443.1 hypothetical protein GCM10011315_31450 [Roseovarius pacificus]
MLPREIWNDGRKLKLPALRSGASNYDYIMYRAAYEITHCLEKWLKVPLDYNETFLPAVLMLNPYAGPVWMHSDQGQEIGDIRTVIKQTRRAKKSVKESIRLEYAGEKGASDDELARALRRMKGLPPPVSLWIENAACQTHLEWAGLLDHIDVLFSEYAKERGGNSGHQRARTVAIVVRALFEVHSDERITLGITEQVPEGSFGKCLQEVFSWAGIPVNFYRYAREARQLARDDHQLKKYIDILQEHYVEEPPTPRGHIIYL